MVSACGRYMSMSVQRREDERVEAQFQCDTPGSKYAKRMKKETQYHRLNYLW